MSAGLIYKKIIAIMSEADAIAKSHDNKQQGFKFRSIDDVYNMLHPRLAKHGVFTTPEVLEERREERQTKTGGVMTYVILKIKFTFFAEDGSSVSTVVIGEGADSGDKASNKAQAVAHKYALLQVFAIPTADLKDPDFESPEFKPKAQDSNESQAATTKRNVAAIEPRQSNIRKMEACECGGKLMKSKFGPGLYCTSCRSKYPNAELA